MGKPIEGIAQKLIDEIFVETRDLSDKDYCDVLEEIAGVCDDAVSAKRQEMEKEG